MRFTAFCARAASGQATAAPPMSVMKSRRPMGFLPQGEDDTLAQPLKRELCFRIAAK